MSVSKMQAAVAVAREDGVIDRQELAAIRAEAGKYLSEDEANVLVMLRLDAMEERVILTKGAANLLVYTYEHGLRKPTLTRAIGAAQQDTRWLLGQTHEAPFGSSFKLGAGVADALAVVARPLSLAKGLFDFSNALTQD